jgi:hypothetical protein
MDLLLLLFLTSTIDSGTWNLIDLTIPWLWRLQMKKRSGTSMEGQADASNAVQSRLSSDTHAQ